MMFATLLVCASAAGFHVTVAPAESLWVEVRGAGRTVVLIPGLFGSAFGYRQVTALLDDFGYRTIVVEPLGVGRSSRPRSADYSLTAQADRIAAALDAIGITDALVVGHSIGASMVLRLSYRRPELVRAIVSIDGGPAESVTTASFRRALRFAPLLKLFGGQRRMREELMKQLTSASGDAAWVTPDVIDGYAAAAAADLGQTLRAFQAMADAHESEALAPRLSSIRAPVLLLVGTAPKTAGLQEHDVAIMREQLRQLTIERLPGVGHYIHEEAPHAVAAAVVRLDYAFAAAGLLRPCCN